jgi:hypothetical protein
VRERSEGVNRTALAGWHHGRLSRCLWHLWRRRRWRHGRLSRCLWHLRRRSRLSAFHVFEDLLIPSGRRRTRRHWARRAGADSSPAFRDLSIAVSRRRIGRP